MKKIFLSLILIVTLALFVGCSNIQPQTFESDGISITTNTEFEKVSKADHALYLESEYASISIKREKFDTLNGMTEESQLRDYTNSVLTNNNLTDISPQNFGGTGGYDFFVYDKTEQNKKTSYLVVTIKGTDSFYLATFQAAEDDFKTYEENFKTWAKSIKVDQKDK